MATTWEDFFIGNWAFNRFWGIQANKDKGTGRFRQEKDTGRAHGDLRRQKPQCEHFI
jgi:hypothetical protein